MGENPLRLNLNSLGDVDRSKHSRGTPFTPTFRLRPGLWTTVIGISLFSWGRNMVGKEKKEEGTKKKQCMLFGKEKKNYVIKGSLL